MKYAHDGKYMYKVWKYGKVIAVCVCIELALKLMRANRGSLVEHLTGSYECVTEYLNEYGTWSE